ncbi:MATE family efflux transporter [Endozoicomonas atrinae]|uniref:MATE family efflux transporter n=1 Tax=Endozoicomonas atrinae TaxID=1333660 RepID=UPI003B00F77D
MLFHNHCILREFRALLKLSLPLMGTYLVMSLAGFIDTLMAGQYSSVDLAGVAIAYTAWIPVNVFLVGLLMGKTAFISQLYGAGKRRDIVAMSQQGLLLATGSGIVGLALLSVFSELLIYVVASSAVREIASGYLTFVALGMPGVALSQALRSYLEGQGYVRSVMVAQVLGLLINIPLNYALIYGRFGLPEMGGLGCGIATAVIMWLSPLFMVAYICFNKALKSTSPLSYALDLDLEKLKALIAVGLPIAFTLFCQFLVFMVITILLATHGHVVVGAHQIVFNFSTLLMMVPSAIGGAVTIRAAYHIGSGHRSMANLASLVGLSFTLIAMCVLGTVVWWERLSIVRLYTQDPAVTTLAESLMGLVVLYLLFTAIQQIGAAALRAYQDTFSVMLIMLVCLWVVMLPLGYLLASTDIFIDPMGVKGFWLAMIIAYFIAAMVICYRWYQSVN